jgi:hypothetical protein
LNKFIQTAPFPPHYWLFLVLWIPALPIVDAIRKALVNRKSRGGKHNEAKALKGETL